jgi:branched-chain amino acid transport system ATP-binding protein
VSEAILEIDGIEKRFGGVRAVDCASFAVERGSITALIGPNGAGKSTLFDVASGFQRADGGAIRLDGRSIYRLPAYAIARRGLVRTFQLTKTLSVMTVLDNMLLAATRHPGERLGGSFVRPFAARARERDVRTRALELLDTFDLRATAGDYAGTLSGGQRKLLELARALMLAPRLILLDEPLAGVNPTLGRRLLTHIEGVREREGTTVLFVEHDMEVVMNHSDRVIVMAQGRVIADGAPSDVRRNEAVVEAYLGKLVVQ